MILFCYFISINFMIIRFVSVGYPNLVLFCYLFQNVLSQSYFIFCFKEYFMTVGFILKYFTNMFFYYFISINFMSIRFVLEYFCHNGILLFVSEYFMTIGFISEYFCHNLTFWFVLEHFMTIRFISEYSCLSHNFFVFYFRIFLSRSCLFQDISW